jgi:hypothetical protein
MLSKSSINLGTRTTRSLVLKIHYNQSMIKKNLTNNLLKTRRVMERRRRTLESGAISTKSPGKTLMNVTQKNHWWSISKKNV